MKRKPRPVDFVFLLNRELRNLDDLHLGLPFNSDTVQVLTSVQGEPVLHVVPKNRYGFPSRVISGREKIKSYFIDMMPKIKEYYEMQAGARNG